MSVRSRIVADVQNPQDVKSATYANRVKELRLAQQPHPWTQRELAKRAGLKPSHLCAIEQGRWIPREITQERIARALGVPRSEVFPA